MNRHPTSLIPAVVSLVLFAGLVSVGCATSKDANSPPGMWYSQGSLRSVETASMERVWRASRAALNALDIAELDGQRGAIAAYLDGRTSDLKKVSVKMRYLSEEKTELKIRISSFGDEELSRLIYEKIQAALAP